MDTDRKLQQEAQQGSAEEQPTRDGAGVRGPQGIPVRRDGKVGSHTGKGRRKPGLKQGSWTKLEGAEWSRSGGHLWYQ